MKQLLKVNILLAQLSRTLLLAAVLCSATMDAQVPSLLNYQGRVAVGTTNFDGIGHFKYALVNADATVTYWSNDGTSIAGSEPAEAVAIPVVKGLYSLLLGDTTLGNMTAIPSAVFNNADIHLRIWFSDGANGSQRLAPDQRIAAVAYAMVAANAAVAQSVPDAAITSMSLASNLTLSGTTTGTFAGNGTSLSALNGSNITAGTVATTRLSPDLAQRIVGFTVDGAGSPVTTGIKGHVIVPFGGTITGWTMIASPSGSVTVDILKTNYDASTLPTASIVGSGTKPFVSSNVANKATSIANWDGITDITSDDIIGWNIVAVDGVVTKLTFELIVTPH